MTNAASRTSDVSPTSAAAAAQASNAMYEPPADGFDTWIAWRRIDTRPQIRSAQARLCAAHTRACAFGNSRQWTQSELPCANCIGREIARRALFACAPNCRNKADMCAEVCLPDVLGLCPIWSLKSLTGLEAGSCAAVGYSDFLGSVRRRDCDGGFLAHLLLEQECSARMLVRATIL